MDKAGSISKAVARRQSLTAVGILAIVGFTITGLDLLAHNQRLMDWVEQTQLQAIRITKHISYHKEYYMDSEDWLVNAELAEANYSRGGVYVFGGSNAEYGSRFSELPAALRALIHNYGLGSLDHLHCFQLVRYLVEQAGLLAAGGEKNMAIFAVSYHDVGSGRSEFFNRLWQRHGLFHYDPKTGITPVKVNPLAKYIDFERERMAGCLTSLLETVPYEIAARAKLERKLNPAMYNAERRVFMGPDWEARMPVQVHEFQETVDYLLARKVHVVVVFLPLGTWEDNLPFEQAYKEQVTRAFQGEPVEILDWSKRLDDDDFADSAHANPNGVDKLQSWFLEIAVPFLRSTHELP